MSKLIYTYTIEREKIEGLNPYLFGERLKDELSLIFSSLNIVLVYGKDSQNHLTLQLQFIASNPTIGNRGNARHSDQLKNIEQEITNISLSLTIRLLEQISIAKLSAA